MIRLLCTFTLENDLQPTIDNIVSNYNILNGKIFVLQMIQNTELACTYNIDSGNLNDLLDNTISIHRRKETNTLYTINGLNFLIRSLNNNILDKNYKINWEDYSNKAILVTERELVLHELQIYKIIHILNQCLLITYLYLPDVQIRGFLICLRIFHQYLLTFE